MYDTRAIQRRSGGDSNGEIHAAALEAAEPCSGLSWLDVGCGKGAILRHVRDRWSPRSLMGLDLIDWLAEDLRDDVELVTGPAEETLEGLPRADRVLMVETLAGLEAPWSVLRAAARLVAPGGSLVVTTPNNTSLRNRLDLLARGQLTFFRPDYAPHLTPVLAHVVERVLREEGLTSRSRYGGRDVMPLTGGRHWPHRISRTAPGLTSVSLIVVGETAEGDGS
jgi:2-polyprenyl-3-methyl-5-hydroxy-6-metoxy-1,4-benzoquinol methylase